MCIFYCEADSLYQFILWDIRVAVVVVCGVGIVVGGRVK